MTWILLGLLSSFALAQNEIESPPIYLGVGEQRLLQVPGLKKYSIGSQIIKTTGVPGNTDRMLVKGVLNGVTDLWVWKSDSVEHRTVIVEKVSSHELASPLLKALSQLSEVEIIYAGTSVILRGEIRDLKESAKIQSITAGFPKVLTNETVLAESLLNTGILELEKWFSRSPYKNSLRLERIGKSIWIRGSISNPNEKSKTETEIRNIFPATEFEIDSFPDHSPTIHFRVYLLELKKNQFSSFGIKWPDFQEGAFRVTTSAITDFLQLNLTLSELEGEGDARILSTPELVVRAPGEAELFAGGEIPIRFQRLHFENVLWKSYGLKLKLKVTHFAGSAVRLDIEVEVSHLDQTIGVDKIPGIQSSRMKTQVDATLGQPLLLTGLLQSGTREQARGLPLLRSIPLLGVLFGSEDYLNERSELVAILLPSSQPPAAPMHRIHPQLFPKGPVPPPRDWMSLKKVQALQSSANYPWNVFE
jgi:Flp pilus assembly secretin CpaC